MFNIDIQKLEHLFLYDPKNPMIFNTSFFFFIFTGFLIIYQFVYKYQKPKVIFLLIFSLYFYYKSSGLFLFLLCGTALVDFILARIIFNSETKIKKRFFLILSLASNLGILGYFKYTNFFLSTLNSIFGSNFQMFNVFLPIGISFFTFQSLSYTIDVYRGKISPIYNFLDYYFFVSFFPQLVSGPIMRASDFIPQIDREVIVSKEDVGMGFYLILSGLVKKALIADYISTNFVDRIFSNPSLYSGIENLFGVYGYSLQIYCDFSGYSDMAIGIALLLGFKLCKNFNSPYIASSLTDFWRRWHISLSSWLKDYLYISLGGNRKGKFRQYINLFLTMLLGGLWHGANWRFVVWGGMHGAGLMFDKIFTAIFKFKKEHKILKIIGIIFTFHFVCLSWIFFRVDSFSLAISMIKQITTAFNFQIISQLFTSYNTVFILMISGFILHFIPSNFKLIGQKIIRGSPFYIKALYLTVIIFLIIQVKTSDIKPFIYFQF